MSYQILNKMGIDVNKIKEASHDSKKMQSDLMKISKELSAQYSEIIFRMNWIMTTQQEICNSLKIKLKDPLEKQ